MMLDNVTRAPMVVVTGNDSTIVLTGNGAIVMTGVKDTHITKQTVSWASLPFVRGPKNVMSVENEPTRISKSLNCQIRKRRNCMLQINVLIVRKQDIPHAHALNGTM